MRINEQEREAIWNRIQSELGNLDNDSALELTSQILASLVIDAFNNAGQPLDVTKMTAFTADIMSEMFRGQTEMNHNMTKN